MLAYVAIFLSLLLLSGAAEAQKSTTVTVPITVTHVSVPPGAAAAGFTTVALNSDFTQPQPANWLGGCANPGNGAPLSPMFYDDGVPHVWWQNIWWSAQYQG